MVTLYLVRHAEAESSHPDMDRQLTPYGETQAHTLGQVLKKHHIQPDHIICSPAVRTQTTAQYIGAALEQPVKTEPAIYNASLKTLLDILQTFNATPSILLVGHNPGVSLLANYLLNTSKESLDPCSLRIIELPIAQWDLLMPHSGSLREL